MSAALVALALVVVWLVAAVAVLGDPRPADHELTDEPLTGGES